jgi:hypothetical protein
MNPLQGWVGSFITSHEQPTLKMDFLHGSFIDESTELAHPLPMKPTIVLILCLVNHVEVPTDYPWTQLNLHQLMKLLKEGRFVTAPRWAVNRCKPPLKVTRDLPHSG